MILAFIAFLANRKVRKTFELNVGLDKILKKKNQINLGTCSSLRKTKNLLGTFMDLGLEKKNYAPTLPLL